MLQCNNATTSAQKLPKECEFGDVAIKSPDLNPTENPQDVAEKLRSMEVV